ncbi:glutamyl-tRNA synthase [Alkalihalobacillus alcalophilus ATCC 27647 = CGMCC 1.3604]|uniref:Glutamate--tRNA ligase n=1 Tax=Alkalihalobacillus alcalophilus ATCC 27647 = CGMCC 1.3604 TaxID=1218173 RepID=A0A094WKS4_ALKAL|nr:glutamate--tRNA ligase [Alkalihalobacillus alcalophilus]KGA98339.1 glutamyl-tRNA synthetase [Alkalihalobacillus alcalophilus ATCC 27647 = CGMCC 1.3604]MED1561657.1 glutamate--tRNA ligase [Alkalihalobacillus alcalophilus]THG89935.1 glutamyl-tRNA synthase [Alkalihalobacillus alcalophilus ATCC 27647 = CGMCC 1.3604]
MTKDIRVRFAPSPTGHLHIGGARSALFNYLYAKNQGGQFILRIEDTDQARNVDSATEKLLESLKWLGIHWDESIDVGGPYGPYRSMERTEIYQEYLEKLLSKGDAYYCYMTEEELQAEREAQLAKGETPKYSGRDRDLTDEQRKAYEEKGLKPVIRFRVPEGKVIKIEDAVRGEVSFESDGIGDFVIARKDGVPMYNFAVVIDDYLMKITHVIRGEEHLSNTPRQVLLYEALGLEVPTFAHASLILNADRQKMSKRDESIIQFVEQYKDLGYRPDAIVNFLALLGWSPVGEEEIFSLEDLEKQFSLERVLKSPAVFDTDKLAWMNNQYMKKADLDEVLELTVPHLVKAGRLPEVMSAEQTQWVKRLVGLYQEQLHYGAEIVELTELFFKEEIEYNEEAQAVLNEEQVPEVMQAFLNELEQLEEFVAANIKSAIKATQKATGQKGKKLFMPIRVATTGQTHGRELDDSIELLGKEIVVARLKKLV